MIYAEIVYVEEEKKWKGFVLNFHWSDSTKEADLWSQLLLPVYNNEFSRVMHFDGNYLADRRMILGHLANRRFIPWGDNIFYKKSFFDFFR